ncbi:MAG: hypothetical protein MUE42_15680 [Opitutaceae bacterium]|nr:hypothetical protein [Opitutaceae bacterium]
MSGILEYGVVTLRGGLVVETQTRLCRAQGRVRADDEALHGLSATMVAGEAPFKDEFGRFAALRETGPLAAHYAQAENALIKSVWPYPRVAPDFARPEIVRRRVGVTTRRCTMRWRRRCCCCRSVVAASLRR